MVTEVTVTASEEEYQQCIGSFLETGESDIPSALYCITNASTEQAKFYSDGMKVLFLVYCASLVFLMQAGFAMICSGCVREKNVQNTTLKNLLDCCGSSVAFYAVGYAFAFGGNPTKTSFIGTSNFFLLDMPDLDENGLMYAHWLFHYAFAATSATIVAGTLAERCQMAAYLLYSMMLTGFVYPVIVHNVWSSSGFLNPSNEKPLFGVGMIDFAGSGVVHVTGGVTALVASILLGARKSRFYDDNGNKLDPPKTFQGHSKSLQMLGSFILWFGWFGFNAGSAVNLDTELRPVVIAKAVSNTILCASCSGIVALVVNLILIERRTGEPIYKLSAAMNGCLTGLAAVSASCGLIEPWAAIVIGIVAGLLYLLASSLLVRFCIDDAVDAIPVHLAGGAWGVIATGLFASPRGLRDMYLIEPEHMGWFYSWGRNSGDFSLLGCQLVGLLFILAWTSVLMIPFFVLLNYLGLFRSDSLEEIIGLDISYHGYSPTTHEDVSEDQLIEYYRQHRRSPHILVETEETDPGNVDRFE